MITILNLPFEPLSRNIKRENYCEILSLNGFKGSVAVGCFGKRRDFDCLSFELLTYNFVFVHFLSPGAKNQ